MPLNLKTAAIALVFAAALLWLGFGIGRYTTTDRMAEGYWIGQEDGYSIGYVDGANGVYPNPWRGMTADDYEIREAIGGRPEGY